MHPHQRGTHQLNLHRDPRVMIAVNDPANPNATQLLIKARAELIEEGAKEVIDKLAKKYTGHDEYPWLQPGERRITIRVVPGNGPKRGGGAA